MEYYTLLQLEREPFSNSPDPEYFFHSRQHLGCLQKLELALRLKRGLNVVMGNVGSGKTTLCREIIRKLANESEFETHLILDPAISTVDEFIRTLYELLCRPDAHPLSTISAMKESIKQCLFRKGVDQGRTVILIIDEGQKISAACIEILRELLNYETNTYKLLQIVIFAQEEFHSILTQHPNFADRVNLLHRLGPMSFRDTRQLIRHRLKLSSSRPKPIEPFSLPALWAIFRYSQGYPRRIIHLCHQSILAMIIQNRTRAGWALIRSCRNRSLAVRPFRRRLLGLGSAAMVLLMLLILSLPEVNLISRARLFVKNTIFSSATSGPLPIAAPESHISSTANDASSAVAALSVPAPLSIAKLETVAEKGMPPETFTSQVPQTAKSQTTMMIEPNLEPARVQPSSLGTLKVQNGDTLYHMISSVYGSYRVEYMEAVLKANPQIDNPNSIKHGSSVNFPVMPFSTLPSANDLHWIILARTDSLSSSRKSLADLKRTWGVPVKLIATWTPEHDLVFHLVYGGNVHGEEKARAMFESLPRPLSAHAQIVSEWPPGTRFYSDPIAETSTFGSIPMKR